MIPSDLNNDEKLVLITVYKREQEINKKAQYKKDICRIKFDNVLFLVLKKYHKEFEYLSDSFEPYTAGPYNEYLDEIIYQLSDYGLIENYEKSTKQGKEMTVKILNEYPVFKEIDNILTKLFNFVSSINDTELLYILYNLYPEYFFKSYIKDKMLDLKAII
jgi:uncharacterized protein YwgA